MANASASEVTLKEIGEYVTCIHDKELANYTTNQSTTYEDHLEH